MTTGYESLKEWDSMDELIFEEPHVTGGIARIHIRVYQILQFMDTIYANRNGERPSDDILVGDFIANHGAYKRYEKVLPQPVFGVQDEIKQTKSWAEALSEYWLNR